MHRSALCMIEKIVHYSVQIFFYKLQKEAKLNWWWIKHLLYKIWDKIQHVQKKGEKTHQIKKYKCCQWDI